jgi:hypothetical protein
MLTLINLFVCVVCTGLIAHYVVQLLAIRRFAKTVAEARSNPFEVSLELAGIIFSTIPRRPKGDPVFIGIPFLSFLGASPGAILKNGGCCSGLTRLYIVCSNALAIPAAQITLCNRSGLNQHCLAEVSLAEHNLLVDPTYGIYYVDSKGKPLSMLDLRDGAIPQFRSLPHSPQVAYPNNTYYDWEYMATKTANWSLSWAHRKAHILLSAVTGGKIDQIKQPVVLEWPQLILACAAALLLTALNLAGRP